MADVANDLVRVGAISTNVAKLATLEARELVLVRAIAEQMAFLAALVTNLVIRVGAITRSVANLTALKALTVYLLTRAVLGHVATSTALETQAIVSSLIRRHQGTRIYGVSNPPAAVTHWLRPSPSFPLVALKHQ